MFSKKKLKYVKIFQHQIVEDLLLAKILSVFDRFFSIIMFYIHLYSNTLWKAEFLVFFEIDTW